MRNKQTTAITFGGPVDTQQVSIMGKRLEVMISERWDLGRYMYDWLLVGDRIIAVYAGYKERRVS